VTLSSPAIEDGGALARPNRGKEDDRRRPGRSTCYRHHNKLPDVHHVARGVVEPMAARISARAWSVQGRSVGNTKSLLGQVVVDVSRWVVGSWVDYFDETREEPPNACSLIGRLNSR
jgi:hypothetical protein